MTLACVTEAVPTDETGSLVAFVRGWAAKREWAQIRERTMRAKRALLERGVFLPGSTPLYGYRHEDGRRVIVEAEAAVVRQIFAWYVDEGCSVREIARRLNAAGIPAPSVTRRRFRDGRTPRWGKSTIGRILTEPAYVGETWALRWDARPHRNPRVRDARQWIRLPDDITPAIVERAVWERAQERLRQNRGEATRNGPRPYLLRGLIWCAVCGRRLYADSERGRFRVYRCASRESASGACGAGRVPAERIERWIWEQVTAFLSDRALVEAEVARRQNAPGDPGLVHQRERVVRELARIAAQQERLVRRYAQATDEEETLWTLVRKQVAELEAEKARVQAQLAEVEAALAEQERRAAHLVTLAEYVRRVQVNLARMTWEERRQVLEILRVRVIAAGSDPAGWTWTWGA